MEAKRIIIMGATSGIGLECAERLAAAGYKVGVAGRCVKVMEGLKELYPEQIEWAQIDITLADAPARLMSLIDRIGGMDTYFHISGVGHSNPTIDPTLELRTVATNVDGLTRMVDAAYAWFRDHNGGRGQIATVSSVSGVRGIGWLASYSASKSFAHTYFQALDQISRSQGLRIRFTDIRPGWIRTPMLIPGRSYPLMMSLDYAVPRILAALHSRRRVVYIDWRWALVAAMMRLVPECLWRRLRLRISAIDSHI